MSRSPGWNQLNPQDWERLQDAADLFEDAWRALPDPRDNIDLCPFLPKPDDPLRPAVLQELDRLAA